MCKLFNCALANTYTVLRPIRLLDNHELLCVGKDLTGISHGVTYFKAVPKHRPAES